MADTEEASKPDNPEDSNLDDVHVATALNLTWSFGINKNIPVLNLSNAQRKALFYATAHTGVLYDFKNNTEILYQGHCNAITCTCVSADKRWLATSDIGNDCMLIVWDTDISVPIKTIFDVDPVGIITMAFSSCAKYIATLSCSFPQVLSIWDWTTETDTPVATLSLDETFGLQTYVTFDTNDVHKLISNNGKQVIFYKWNQDGDVDFVAPALNNKDFNKTVGTYSQSVFQPNSTNAFTATNCGNIVVWTEQPSTHNGSINRKAFKIVKLQEKAITTLSLMNNNIVTGDITGNVKFFDMDLKLINWYSKLGCQGAINSVSFTYIPHDKHSEPQTDDVYPTSSTLKATPFVVTDFSVSTTKANFLYYKTEGSSVEYICKEHDEDIKAIACHPKGPFIAVGGFGGLLQVRDFETKSVMCSRQFTGPSICITCLAYSTTGDYLAIGFEDGTVMIIDSITLEVDGAGETKSSFKFSRDAILKLVFSHDSSFLACSDMDMCVVVFNFQPKNKAAPWCYLGKHRAHYKQIKDLMFTAALDEDYPRLMSIGQDRMLVEYDLKNSSVDDLKVFSSDRIEQDGIPICLATYPEIVKESFITVANDQYKMKLFNSTTKMCRHTFLAPTYGSPVQRMVMLPGVKDSSHRYMAYITYDKVGLMILPLDGNPHRSMALIAHPGMVHNIACSFDGQYIFTAGGSDTSVLMWKVDTNALEATASLGGEGLVPFYSLLEGGREGELFSELEEYFYYAQMRNQGVDSMSKRNASTEIPLSEIPFIMRALGFYPTEQQIEEMINEVKFSEYVITGKYVNTVDLGSLIKLYVNHRPAFGLDANEIVDAFEKLGYSDNGNSNIDRDTLLQLLQDKGEHLTETELAEYIAQLLQSPIDNDNEDDDDINQQIQPIEDLLPEKISVQTFTSEILGFSTEEMPLIA